MLRPPRPSGPPPAPAALGSQAVSGDRLLWSQLIGAEASRRAPSGLWRPRKRAKPCCVRALALLDAAGKPADHPSAGPPAGVVGSAPLALAGALSHPSGPARPWGTVRRTCASPLVIPRERRGGGGGASGSRIDLAAHGALIHVPGLRRRAALSSAKAAAVGRCGGPCSSINRAAAAMNRRPPWMGPPPGAVEPC